MINLTKAMQQDLKFVTKNKSAAQIIEFLEAKFNIKKLNYQTVYYAFRKDKFLFGVDDCLYFYKYMKDRNFIIFESVNQTNQSLCSLIFASQIMVSNYRLYGDMVLIDITYNTNVYKVPLVVFSGIGADGRNIVFGMAYVNNETYETYRWLGDEISKVNLDSDLEWRPLCI